jgi:hypothetical protein
MASRASLRHRDTTRAYAVLAFAACGFSFFIFVAKIWSPVWPEIPPTPQLSFFSNDGSDAIYTGSIRVSVREDLCQERTFDNRTGKYWDRGVVKCDAAASLPVERSHTEGMSTMQIIRKSFLHNSN